MSSTYNDFNRNLIKHLRENKGKAPAGPFEGRDLVTLPEAEMRAIRLYLQTVPPEALGRR